MLPEDQVRVMGCILVSVPLCWFLRQLRGSVRKYWSMVVGGVLECYAYRAQIWIPMVMHLLIYGVLLKGQRRKCGLRVTVLAMVCLSLYHLYRMLTDYGSWRMDVSTILMGNVCRYSYLAYSYQDGQNAKQLTLDQRNQKIVQLPSFVDFISYCLFLPMSVVTNGITYSKYEQFIKRGKQFDCIPVKESLVRMGKDLGGFVVSAGFYLMGTIYFPVSFMMETAFIRRGFWYIVYYSFVSIHLLKFKYFVAFKLLMLPIHASGLSYDPNLSDKFGGVQTVNIKAYLTTISLPMKISSWNIPSQQWLRKCIYERASMQKNKAKLLTFIVSAFWHGMYGGYYIAFTFFFIEIYLSSLVFKLSKYQNHPLVKFYHQINPYSFYFLWALITYFFTHTGTYFVILSAKECLKILQALYFMPPLLFLFFIAAVHIILVMAKRGQKEKSN